MKKMATSIAADFRVHWKRLFVTDVIYKLFQFILLTPLLAVVSRTLLVLSGHSVLADQDILLFFLTPAGWLSLILVGAAGLAIAALELSALFTVLTGEKERPVPPLVAIWIAMTRAWPLLQVAARAVGWMLLTVAPFLAITGGVYFLLLSDYDINYYLQEKPPAFLWAIGIAVLIVISLAAVLMRLMIGWLFALPLVLLENIPPSRSLAESRIRTQGHRQRLLAWMLGWILVVALLSVAASTLLVGLGRIMIPAASGSLALLTVAIGTALALGLLVNLCLNLLATSILATIILNLYRDAGGQVQQQQWHQDLQASPAGQMPFRLTRGRLIAAGILGILFATACGILTLQTVEVDDRVQVIAHRGSSDAAPENTLAAIRQAIADGADWVEIDVQETADDQVVVFHDSDFMKLAGQPLKIWDATMDDLSQIDIGSWFSSEFQNERVPTLGQVLDLCRGKIRVNIELKYYGHEKQLEQRVIDIVEAHEMTSNVVFMSLKLPAVRKLKRLRPEFRVGWLMSVSAGNLKQIPADFLAVNAGFVDRNFVRAAHSIGKQVLVWTVNDAVPISNMASRGVDGIITDKPALARAVLAQRASLSPAERLLLEMAQLFGIPFSFDEQ